MPDMIALLECKKRRSCQTQPYAADLMSASEVQKICNQHQQIYCKQCEQQDVLHVCLLFVSVEAFRHVPAGM